MTSVNHHLHWPFGQWGSVRSIEKTAFSESNFGRHMDVTSCVERAACVGLSLGIIIPFYRIVLWLYRVLVGGLNLPLWKMMELKSVGMMTFPTEWKNNPNVPNHQPELYINHISQHFQSTNQISIWGLWTSMDYILTMGGHLSLLAWLPHPFSDWFPAPSRNKLFGWTTYAFLFKNILSFGTPQL